MCTGFNIELRWPPHTPNSHLQSVQIHHLTDGQLVLLRHRTQSGDLCCQVSAQLLHQDKHLYSFLFGLATDSLAGGGGRSGFVSPEDVFFSSGKKMLDRNTKLTDVCLCVNPDLVPGPQVLVLLLALTQSLPLSIQSLNQVAVLQTPERELLRQNQEPQRVRDQLLTFHTHTISILSIFSGHQDGDLIRTGSTCAVCRPPPAECSLTVVSSPPPSPAPACERS